MVGNLVFMPLAHVVRGEHGIQPCHGALLVHLYPGKSDGSNVFGVNHFCMRCPTCGKTPCACVCHSTWTGHLGRVALAQHGRNTFADAQVVHPDTARPLWDG